MHAFLHNALRALERVFAFLAVFAFSAIAVRTFLAPRIDWDYLAYHLPFSMTRYGLTSFEVDDNLLLFLDGLPPLAQFIQGGIIALLGRPFAGVMASFLLVAAYLIAMAVVIPNLRPWTLLASLFAIPFFPIMLQSGYVDLYHSVALAAALVCMFAKDLGSKCDQRFLSLLFLLSLNLAVLLKMQAWPIAALFGLIFVYRRIRLRRRENFLVGWELGGLMILAAWPLRNTVLFGSPFYPLRTPLLQFDFPGVTYLDAHTFAAYPDFLKVVPQLGRFLASVFEVSRSFSNHSFAYSIDQWSAVGTSDPNFRMGGWSWLTCVFVPCALFITCRRNPSMRAASLTLLATFVFVGFLPQSHELRYWTFLPIAGLSLFSIALSRGNLPMALRATYLGVITYSVSQTTQFFEVWRPIPGREEIIPKAADEYVLKRRQNGPPRNVLECALTPVEPTLYWAGEKFNEFRVKNCGVKP